MSRYCYWLKHKGVLLRRVETLPDGSLYNPDGYPDDFVREAVNAEDERIRVLRHERLSQAAKKGLETRRNRKQAKTHIAAQRVAGGQGTGPRHRCCVCGRVLTDPQSIARGIGSDCWQDVLDVASEVRAQCCTSATGEHLRP